MKIFHVHTFRCRHAEEVPDEAYVKAAVALGASDIWFTDHAPFPGDPFGSRMRYSELEEYISTISALKKQHTDINVHIGLEAEYFPGFDKAGYYEQLRSIPELELLLLGQHMAEISSEPLDYSFSLSGEELEREEYRYLGNAILHAIDTGYFGAVAHPDRIFRRSVCWDEDKAGISRRIIKAASDAGIPIERNLSSPDTNYGFTPEFWKLVPVGTKLITGLDAHCVSDMVSRTERQEELLALFG